MKRKKDINDLRWVRIFTASHIPRYLIEQIAKRDYKVDDLYTYLEANLLIPTQNGPTLNPIFHVWALVDKENLVRGFLWFTVDPLSKDICIQIYSVDPNYWGCKDAVHKLSEHVKAIRNKASLKKIYWITPFPKHSQKYGYKPSSSVLMEYDEDKEKTKDKKNGESIQGADVSDRPNEPGATQSSK